MTDLKTELRHALKGSSAQKPVDFGVLAKGHLRSRVEAALMEMYGEREVGCCKVFLGSLESTVWWISGVFDQTPFYGKTNKPKALVVKPHARKGPRLSPITLEVIALVFETPGLSISELITKLNKHPDETEKIRNAVVSMINSGRIRAKGEKRAYRYYPGVPL